MTRDAHRPGDQDDTESLADDRFVHGLLGFMHEDSPRSQADRVRGVMKQLATLDAEAEADTPPPRATPARRKTVWWTRGWSVTALATIAIAAILFVGLPGEQSAHALINSAILAGQDAPVRRYELSAAHEGGDSTSIGEMDISGNHVVVRMVTPEGHTLTLGRDDAGAWTIRRNGTIERFDAERQWPRWINLGDGTMMVESVDALLGELHPDFELELADKSAAEPRRQRVTARRTDDHMRPGPDRYEIWIHMDTNLVERLELCWDRSRIEPRDRDGGPGGPRRPRAGDRPGRPRGGPRGDGADRRPPRREGVDPPPRRGDQPPRGERPHPRLIDGPPRFAAGDHPPPPKQIVFQRVETPALPDGWFSPEAHIEP